MRALLLAAACLLLACDALKPGLKKCGNCPDNAGELRCDGQSIQFCNLESPTSDCYSWETHDCGPGFTCVAGAQPSCESTCLAGHACTAGALRCSATGESERCGLLAECYAWLPAEPCSGGGRCECADGARRCTASGERQACALAGNCFSWEPPAACGTGQLCSSATGACEPLCLASALYSAGPGSDRPACALVAGAAYCWGRNGDGQLGTGTTAGSSAPVAASALGADLVQLALLDYGNATCARTAGGKILCAGDNRAGALGAGISDPYSTSARQVSGLAGAVDVAAGSHHACAVLGDGSAWCWGAGDVFQLGTDVSGGFAATPVAVRGLSSGVARVYCGALACCARLAAGTVRCWGFIHSLVFSATPATFSALAGAEEIALTRGQICALLGGGVVCAGHSGRGSLGDGTRTFRAAFGGVSGLSSDVLALAAESPEDQDGAWCALKADGSLWCWGAGGRGGVLAADALEPVQVDAGPLAALGGHLFVGRSDGTWWGTGGAAAAVVGCR